MLVRLVGIVAVAVLAVGSATARSQAQEALRDWRSALESASCPGSYGQPATYDLDTIIAVAASYSTSSVADFALRARVNVVDYLMSGSSLARAQDGEGYADRILAANPGGLQLLRSDIARYGERLCPLIGVIETEGLGEITRKQIEVRDYYQPQSRLAQAMLNLHGCGAGEADGLFGKGSVAAWNRAADGSGLALKDEGGLPTPGDILALAEAGEGRPLCAANPAQAKRFDAPMLLRTLTACHAGKAPETAWAPIGWQLAALASEGDVIDADRLETVLGEVFGACSSQMAPTEETDRESRSDQVQPFLKTVFAALPDWPADLASIEAISKATRKSIWKATGLPEEDDEGRWKTALSSLGLGYYEGNGLPRRPDVGVYLVGLANEGTDRWTGGDVALVRGAVAGVLPDTLPEGMRQALADLLQKDDAGSDEPYNDDGEAELGAYAYIEPFWAGENNKATVEQIALDFSVPISTANSAVELAKSVADDPAFSVKLRAEGSPQANAIVATLLLEGFVDGKKNLPLALHHFRAAADKGNSFALLRLAQMHEQGYGVPQDIEASLDFYREAADQGQTAASLALARFYETGTHVPRDWDKALAYYRAGLGLDDESGRLTDGAAGVIQRRLLNGSDFFTDGPGRSVLEEALVIIATVRREDMGWNMQATYVEFAIALGDAFAGLDGGPTVDLGKAAEWYRIADDEDADAKLIRILLAQPELQADESELARLTQGTLLGLYRTAPGIDAFKAAVDEICRPAVQGFVDCVEFHRVAALGGFDPNIVAYAHDWLAQAAADEETELREQGRLAPYESSMKTRPAYAIAGWVDVLSYYGDHAGALEPLRLVRNLPGEGEVGASRGAAFRRALARHLDGGPEAVWEPLARLLQALASRGDEAARDLLELASTANGPKPDIAVDIDAARERFALAEGLAGNTMGLALSARQLAKLEADAGNRLRAVELELVALNADMARYAVTAVWNGPIEASLGRVCSLSKASEQLYALDEAAMALTLAKRAVNELQDVRRRISGLPEHLQLCFRDTISDHYRWLADLFISQDRPAEASTVLGMLKSFETFEFLGRDTEFAGDAFAPLEMSPVEEALSAEIDAVRPTVTAMKIRRRELLLNRKKGELTGAEETELASLTDTLVASREEMEKELEGLIAASDAVHSTVVEDLARNVSSVRAHLRRAFDGKAAAIQYVVLPDRIGAILTTAVSERVFSWTEWEGVPFTEERLNAGIEDLRKALQNPGADPKPASKALHDLVLPEALMRELKDAGAQTLILSLDRRLRYVPFAALYDGDDYLVENFDLTHATETRSVGGGGASPDRIAGFGTTQSWYGLSPLPGVADELASIVREGGEDAQGVVEGTIHADADFTRDTMASAMIFGDFDEPALGIVHLASHFILGSSEDDSYLLLGDGDRLTVADIKDSFGMDLDFAEVGVLTLSACETAYSGQEADGRELESFAAVAQQKGALEIVATLWPINDRSTAVFMQEFYQQQIDNGLSVASALAQVQRQFLRGEHKGAGSAFRSAKSKQKGAGMIVPDETHPYYWAPIVVMEGTS
ncbi:MAG: hypothetical protein CL534_24450 [Ahrensia sp.]|nr:hypothetical protein [Ahrensia sp.]